MKLKCPQKVKAPKNGKLSMLRVPKRDQLVCSYSAGSFFEVCY